MNLWSARALLIGAAILLIPTTAFAYYQHCHHGGYSSYGYQSHGYTTSPEWNNNHWTWNSYWPLAPRTNYYPTMVRPSYAAYVPPMAMGYNYYTPPTVSQPTAVGRSTASDYYVVTSVCYCELRDGERACRRGVLDARNVSVDQMLLPQVGEAHGLGTGYQVTASFTRQPDGRVDVTVSALPKSATSGRRAQSMTGSGRSSVEALRSLLTSVP